MLLGFPGAALLNQGLPWLSAAVDEANGAVGATISVHTSKNGGIVYAVVSTGSIPSKAQVKAGLMHTGAPAAWAGSEPGVVGTINFSPAPSGLSPGTFYTAYFMHELD